MATVKPLQKIEQAISACKHQKKHIQDKQRRGRGVFGDKSKLHIIRSTAEQHP